MKQGGYSNVSLPIDSTVNQFISKVASELDVELVPYDENELENTAKRTIYYSFSDIETPANGLFVIDIEFYVLAHNELEAVKLSAILQDYLLMNHNIQSHNERGGKHQINDSFYHVRNVRASLKHREQSNERVHTANLAAIKRA